MKTITSFFAILAISLASVSVFAQPTVAPTAPISRPVSSVISIYGTDTYTPITGVNTFPDWGQSGQGSTFTTYTIAGTSHNLLKYGKLSYQGIDFTGNAQDVSGMKYLHMDIWTADAAVSPLSVAIINGNSNIAVSKTITTTGTWYSLDILLTEFTGQNLTAINQLMFKSTEWSTYATNTLQKDIYVDNIYFWTDVVPALAVSTTSLTIAQPVNSTNTFNITTSNGWTVASDQTWLTPSSTIGTGNATITLTATTANDTYFARTANVTITGSSTIKTIVVTQAPLMPASAPIPTVLAAKVKSIYSDSYTPAVTVTAFDNWWNMNFSDCIFASSDNGKKVVTTAAGNCGSPTFTGTPLDITSMTNVHIDVYPLSTIDIGLQLVTIAHGGSTGWVSLGALTPNQWNSKDIALSNFIMTAKTDLQQVGFVTTATFGTFYMDNLYFYNDGTTALSNVISENGISCYPNPIMNNVTVSAKTEINQVSIHNLLGQTVKSTYIHGLNKTIDLSDLASGNYFITLKLANGQLTTQKLVKL